MENQVIAGRFRLTRQIGAGSFGQIFECTNLRSGKTYAAKVENNIRTPQLAHESTVYQKLANGVNVCQLHWYGAEKSDRVAIFDLLGDSLEQIRSSCGPLSLKSVLMLIDQMLRAIEFVHRRNFVHRDIKPDNFVMGRGSAAGQLYIIDFGLAKPYRDAQTLVHHPMATGRSLTGTARYASVNALRGLEQSRRDDMEAMGYVWVYLLAGGLPWMGITAPTQEERNRLICECKSETTLESLCNGLPPEFIEYFKCIGALQFADEPPYAQLRAMFRDLTLRLGFACDGVYEWNRCVRFTAAVSLGVMKPLRAVSCSDDPLSSAGGDDSEMTASDDSSEWSDTVSLTAGSDTPPGPPEASDVARDAKSQCAAAHEPLIVKRVMITRKKSTTAHNPARFLQADPRFSGQRNPMGPTGHKSLLELHR